MGPISCPETSVINHNSTLRKIPEERRSQLLSSQERLCFVELFIYLLFLFLLLLCFLSWLLPSLVLSTCWLLALRVGFVVDHVTVHSARK
jgi:hypothetical protein